jgi:hypothetical protein
MSKLHTLSLDYMPIPGRGNQGGKMTDIIKANEAKATRGGREKFPEGFFSMASDAALEKFGTSVNLPPSQRLQNLAQSRMNRWGHCPFFPGEMRVLVACDPRTLKKAIDSMKKAGMFAEESTEECIVFSSLGFRRADRSNDTCMERGHMNRKRRMWVHGWGWEPEEGAWVELLKDGDTRKAIASGELSGWGHAATVTEVELTGRLEGTLRVRQATVPIAGVRYSDYGNPMCARCGIPVTFSPDRAMLQCPYGHEYPAA